MTRPQLEPSRIVALDGLRGIAIIAVLIAHSSLSWHLTPAAAPFEYIWTLLVGTGRFGVDLFFVLSAFLITGILLNAKGSGGGLRNFYGRRALRILPLYYLVLLIVLPLQAPGAISGWEPWYWLNLSNWASAQGAGADTGSGYNVFWSLAVEEQFYVLWPLLVLALPSRRLLQVATGGICAGLIFRVGLLANGASVDVVYFATPSHFDSLGVGACLAILARERGLGQFTKAARWVMAGSVGLLAAIGFHAGGLRGDDWAVATIGSTVFAALFGAAVVLAVTGEPKGIVRRLSETGGLRAFGRYSYCVYLIHVPVGATVRLIAYGAFWDNLAPLGLVAHLLIWAAVVGASLGIAWLSWRYIEAPLLSLKRFLPYHSACLQQSFHEPVTQAI